MLRRRSELTRVLQVCARGERELSRLQLASAATRLGSVGVHRSGLTLQEVRGLGQSRSVGGQQHRESS